MNPVDYAIQQFNAARKAMEEKARQEAAKKQNTKPPSSEPNRIPVSKSYPVGGPHKDIGSSPVSTPAPVGVTPKQTNQTTTSPIGSAPTPRKQEQGPGLIEAGAKFAHDIWYGKQTGPEQLVFIEPGVKYQVQPSTRSMMAEAFANIGMGLTTGGIARVAAPAAETSTGLLKNIYRGSKAVMAGAFGAGTGADIGETTARYRAGQITNAELSNKMLQTGIGLLAFSYAAGYKKPSFRSPEKVTEWKIPRPQSDVARVPTEPNTEYRGFTRRGTIDTETLDLVPMKQTKAQYNYEQTKKLFMSPLENKRPLTESEYQRTLKMMMIEGYKEPSHRNLRLLQMGELTETGEVYNRPEFGELGKRSYQRNRLISEMKPEKNLGFETALGFSLATSHRQNQRNISTSSQRQNSIDRQIMGYGETQQPRQRNRELEKQFNNVFTIPRYERTTRQEQRQEDLSRQLQRQLQEQETITRRRTKTLTFETQKPTRTRMSLPQFPLDDNMTSAFTGYKRKKKSYRIKMNVFELPIPTLRNLFGG